LENCQFDSRKVRHKGWHRPGPHQTKQFTFMEINLKTWQMLEGWKY
jgi:hypothetical protein